MWRSRWKPKVTRAATSTVRREQDELHLMVLHLRENEGMTFGQIAIALRMSRNAALGAYRRITLAYDSWCECDKPENKDGGMGPLWWREPEDGTR